MEQQAQGLKAKLADAEIRLTHTTAALLDAARLAALEKHFAQMQAADKRGMRKIQSASTALSQKFPTSI